MPTTQMAMEEQMMQQAIQRANALAAQKQIASEAAKAQLATAQIGADSQRYGYDTQYKGVQDTNNSRLAGTSMEQTGATDRAKINVGPQMGLLDHTKQVYSDTRSDKQNSFDGISDRVKANMLMEAMGGQPMPLGGGGQYSQTSQPSQAMTTTGSQSSQVAIPTQVAQQKPMRSSYNMDGFTGDVADIASLVSAAKGTSNAMGPDDLTAGNDWSKGASIKDASGVRRIIALPERDLMKDKTVDSVKSMIAQEATGQPITTTAQPAQVQPDRMAMMERLGIIKPTQESIDKREQDKMMRDRAMAMLDNADPEIAQKGARILESLGVKIDQSMFEPTSRQKLDRQVSDSKLTDTRTADVMSLPTMAASLQGLVKSVSKISEPSAYTSEEEVAKIADEMNRIIISIGKQGGDMKKAKILLKEQLRKATDKKSALPNFESLLNSLLTGESGTQQDKIRRRLNID